MFSIRLVQFRRVVPPEWNVKPSRTTGHILLFVFEGRLQYRFDNGEPVTFEKHDLVYIPIGTHRSAATCPPKQHQMCSVHFTLTDPAAPALPLLAPGTGVKRIRPQQPEYAKQRFSALADAWRQDAPYADWQCQAITLELLALANRELDWSRYHPDRLAMARAMQSFIEEHYMERLTLKQVAAVADRSPNYACSVFKEVAGLGPIEYANQFRLGKARELLMETEWSVADVAERVGFSDPYYFSKLYKRTYGTAPKTLTIE